jgi:hypothetical protein
VDKSCVDDCVGSRCANAEAFEILERTVMDVCSGCDKRFSCRIRARKAEHLMTSVDQLSDDCRSNETCSAGDKNPHIHFLLSICEFGR